MTVVKVVNFKSSHHKEYFSSSLILYLYEKIVNLLWSSFCDVCKSNHDAVHLILLQCDCNSVVSDSLQPHGL